MEVDWTELYWTVTHSTADETRLLGRNPLSWTRLDEVSASSRHVLVNSRWGQRRLDAAIKLGEESRDVGLSRVRAFLRAWCDTPWQGSLNANNDNHPPCNRSIHKDIEQKRKHALSHPDTVYRSPAMSTMYKEGMAGARAVGVQQ